MTTTELEAAQPKSDDKLRKMYEATVRRLLKPVQAELDDPTVSEIMINGFDEIYVEKKTRTTLANGEVRDQAIITQLNHQFDDQEHLEAAARSIAQYSGKLLSPDELSIEARLYDKSRVHILQPPAARNGMCIAIRKFHKANHSIDNLIGNATLSPQVAQFLQICLLLKKNIVISGGTSTGKTTILNALSGYMEKSERIIVIEDVNELDLECPHSLYFEAQKPDRYGIGGITIRDLFRASLRMRPDRVIVGECRGGEALDMIQAMTSGHSGSITTLHADTPADALNRLETMALMSDVDLPQRPLRSQIASAIDIIVQVQRIGGRRGITSLSEVHGIDGDGNYVWTDIFEKSEQAYDEDNDQVFSLPTGARVAFHRDAELLARKLGLNDIPGINKL